MSDTPRTDALHTSLIRISEGPDWIAGKDYCDMIEHSRQLERENAKLRAKNKLLVEALKGVMNRTVYGGPEDEIGERACCGALSYEEHEKYCEANNAIKQSEGEP